MLSLLNNIYIILLKSLDNPATYCSSLSTSFNDTCNSDENEFLFKKFSHNFNLLEFPFGLLTLCSVIEFILLVYNK